MEIKVRLHPTLRDQLRAAAQNSHNFRIYMRRLSAGAARIVARHGASITYAALNPLGRPLDEVGCAMSAFAPREGLIVVDVDPLGTAIGEMVVVWRPNAATRRFVPKAGCNP